MSYKLKRWELVELIVPAGTTGGRLPYPDIPNLRDDTTQDIIICSLESFTIEAMPLTPNGNVVATTAQLLNCFLVLYIEGEESVHWLPLIKLQNVFQALATGTSQAEFEHQETDYLKVDWNKSYIQFGTPPNPGANFSIMLGVAYKKLPPGGWAMISQGKMKGW